VDLVEDIAVDYLNEMIGQAMQVGRMRGELGSGQAFWRSREGPGGFGGREG
jgi:hypothetical protein